MNCVDFTPEWYHLQQRVRGARRKMLVYIAAMMVAMVAWLMVIRGRLSQAQAALAKSEQGYTTAVQKKTEIEQSRSEQRELQQQLGTLAELSSGFPKRYIYSEVANLLPEKAWLVNLRITKFSKEDETKRGGRLRRRSAAQEPVLDLKFSDVKVTFKVQAPDYATLTDCVENLNSSTFFERVGHKTSRPAQESSHIIEKEITLYVIRTEHIADERDAS